MLTILEQSRSVKKLGPFRTHKWKSSNTSPNTLTETFWNVKTQFRKFNFIQYLKLKVLLGEANLLETRLCYDAPGVLQDNLYCDALRAWRTDVPKHILWQRLQALQRLEGLPEWHSNLLNTWNGVIRYEIEEIRCSIRKVKKYSGYVRNSSSVGSKRGSQTYRPEPESFEWTTNVEKDYYQFLTVGEFNSGHPGSIIFTLMRTKSSKRNPESKGYETSFSSFL